MIISRRGIEMLENGSEQLTRADYKRIEEEIEYRRMVVRPASLKALKEARALGDLSENFEYHCAKRDNNLNNSRIRYLQKMLENATVIDDTSAEDQVGMNNTVRVYFEDDDCEETYRIVTSIRSDSRKGLISNESPMGKALMGHKVGDRVEINTGETSYFVVIRDLEKTGESESDRIRSF